MARILVIGPGALGIPTAIRLHDAEHDVVLGVRDAKKSAWLERNRVRYTAPDGSIRHVGIPTAHVPDGLDPFDIIIHTTKCSVAPAVLEHWMPALAHDGVVVPFQNGLMGDALRQVAGDRFVECSVYWPATLLEPGHSHMTADGHNLLGPWPRGAPSPHHKHVAHVLSAVVPTDTHDDMRAVKWTKLILNSAMTSLGVVHGGTMRDMMAHGPTRKAFLAVIREGLEVMKALGIEPVTVGNAKPKLLAGLPGPVAQVVLQALAKKYGDYQSSSAQSLARGESTEVDYLNGVIARYGSEQGVATPVNRAVVATVHAIECMEVAPGPQTVESMLAGASATPSAPLLVSTP